MSEWRTIAEDLNGHDVGQDCLHQNWLWMKKSECLCVQRADWTGKWKGKEKTLNQWSMHKEHELHFYKNFMIKSLFHSFQWATKHLVLNSNMKDIEWLNNRYHNQSSKSSAYPQFFISTPLKHFRECCCLYSQSPSNWISNFRWSLEL